MRVDGARAVITGAGSGIGRALAHALAGRGAHLVLADTNGTTVREVAQTLGGRRFPPTSPRPKRSSSSLGSPATPGSCA